MNLKITKNRYDQEVHKGKLFPGAEQREYAYQDESVHGSVSLHFHLSGAPPRRGDGKLNLELKEDIYRSYELVIEQHTGKSLTLKLIGHRRDTVAQRNRNGFAVTQDKLVTGMGFGELMNRIFSEKDEILVCHEEEAFPQRVKDAMKGVYDPSAEQKIQPQMNTDEHG